MKINEANSVEEKLAMQLHRIDRFFKRLHHHDSCTIQEGEAEKMSLHRGQGRVLALLNKEGSLSIAEIVEHLDVRPSSGGELISKLEQNGFVSRKTSQDDKRVAIISMTNKGAEVFEKTDTNKEAYFVEMFSGLNEEEKERLSTLLDKLMLSLKEKGEAKGIKMGKRGRHCKNGRAHRHGKRAQGHKSKS